MPSLKYTAQHLLTVILSLQMVTQTFAIPIEANKDKASNALQTRGFITDTFVGGLQSAFEKKQEKEKKEEEKEEKEEAEESKSKIFSFGKGSSEKESSKKESPEEPEEEEKTAAGDEEPEVDATTEGALARAPVAAGVPNGASAGGPLTRVPVAAGVPNGATA
ncbi:hypothetical protein GcM1_235054 [Golovinomyces cichoracearum]|uniref:Uncharacterized protein n=1 Tax=Golovinomyces cichoracearum TaxID=62708 RepID=A0A420IKZ0_9PEZI|nr:hypothetical protein GcM1_235054 [Golovinomyces cichoracearum]